MPFSKKRHSRHASETASPAGVAAPDSATKYSRDQSKYASALAEGRKSRRRKVIKGIVIAVAALAVAAGAAAALYLNNLNSLLSGGLSSDEQSKIDSALNSDASFDKPFYMLLIGSDARSGDSSMGQRSDTNILVRVDVPNSTITMVSIPRDTAINYGDYGTVKFNAAYAYDGAAGTIKAANQLCGVKIAHYASIDFEGLTDLVDAVGGVDVTVDERIDDPDAGDVVIEAGKQHLDGAAALVFARSRAYADGDYTRVSNQRKLIEAVAEKAMSQNVADLSNTVTTTAKYVTTDFSAQDLVSLALSMKGNGDLKIYSATLPSTTGSIDGASYVFADVPGIQAMMKAVDAGKDPGSESVKKAIEKADAQAQNSLSASGGSSSSTAGSNAVTQDESSSAEYGSDGTSSSTSGYDPNYNYNYGIDTANGGNVSGNNYGAVDD